MNSEKIVSFDDAPKLMENLRAEGKQIVQCHGTFDLLHPGHIDHLQQAKALGDILVVTITDSAHSKKGIGRPLFNDELRTLSLAALAAIDYVVLVPHSAAVEAIDCIKADHYCKGKEYKDPKSDPTGNIGADVEAVNRNGGKIHYIGDIIFSSSKLINRYFDAQPKELKNICQQLAQKHTPETLTRSIEEFSKLKVLVIGDIIIDRYTYVDVQGLTSKNQIISGRVRSEETHTGGALAVYRHLKQFCETVSILSLTGTEKELSKTIASSIQDNENFTIQSAQFQTIIKQRFVESEKAEKQIPKLFAVNYIQERHPSPEVLSQVQKQIESVINQYDLILVMDFGHGLMSSEIRKLVQEKASFLALNCQTNSNNHGYNIISRQYERADCFTLDATELALACGKRFPDYEKELAKLRNTLHAQYAFLTRGAIETIGIKQGVSPYHFPAIGTDIVDTVGAGDAFCALTALAAKCEWPIDLATFVGQLAGAQAVSYAGNSKCVDKGSLLRNGISMLNY